MKAYVLLHFEHKDNITVIVRLLFRQFVTRFSQSDWFIEVLKIHTDVRQ